MSVTSSSPSSKWTTKKLRTFKRQKNQSCLHMLTCYDYQSAQMLNQTSVDLLLVGDSLGNVILGLPDTIQVTLEHMLIFAQAVTRGAPSKFTIIDMPFGTYSTVEKGLENSIKLFQFSNAQALKLEGAVPTTLELISRLGQTGIPVMGHIGLTPQSVHQLGGYYTHGKNNASAQRLILEAKQLEEAGAFAIVLECIWPEVALEITKEISIPTIGIGSGTMTDGQVLVLNDLLGLGPNPVPKFVQPVSNLFEEKKILIEKYLTQNLKQTNLSKTSNITMEQRTNS